VIYRSVKLLFDDGSYSVFVSIRPEVPENEDMAGTLPHDLSKEGIRVAELKS